VSALLEVADLKVEFRSHGETTSTPLRGIDLRLEAGEMLGLVGETGCGKTLTGLSVLRLLPASAHATGTVRLDGADVLAMSGRRLGSWRGRAVSMVFQHPGNAFNPVYPVGWQMVQVVRRHLGLSRARARQHVVEHLQMVRLTDVERVADAYPHELSGGILQRAMIATALLCRPRLVVADEPTTALDVTIAAQILDLLRDLQQEHGFAVMLITHNLGVVRSVCDRAAVLYAGRVVETGTPEQLFSCPTHPYTRGLLGALPVGSARQQRLRTIVGQVPSDLRTVRGCSFAPRCPLVHDRCLVEDPAPVTVAVGHDAACLLAAGR